MSCGRVDAHAFVCSLSILCLPFGSCWSCPACIQQLDPKLQSEKGCLLDNMNIFWSAWVNQLWVSAMHCDVQRSIKLSANYWKFLLLFPVFFFGKLATWREKNPFVESFSEQNSFGFQMAIENNKIAVLNLDLAFCGVEHYVLKLLRKFVNQNLFFFSSLICTWYTWYCAKFL